MKSYIYINTNLVDYQIKVIEEKANSLSVSYDNIFIDISDKKVYNNSNFQELKKILKNGDKLYVENLDSLGFDVSDIKKEWMKLIEDNINIRILDGTIMDKITYDEEQYHQIIVKTITYMLDWYNNKPSNYSIQKYTSFKEHFENVKSKNSLRGNNIHNMRMKGEISSADALVMLYESYDKRQNESSIDKDYKKDLFIKWRAGEISSEDVLILLKQW